MFTKPEAIKALIAAHKSIVNVAPDRRNEFHRYNYTSSEALIDEARKALTSNQILAKRSSFSFERDAMLVKSVFTVTHESGDSFQETTEFPVVIELNREGKPIKGLDKAVAVALTTSLGYWFRDLLNIPRGEDMNDDHEAPQEKNQQRPPKPQQAKQTPKPQEKTEIFDHNNLDHAKKVQASLEQMNLGSYVSQVCQELSGKPFTKTSFQNALTKLGIKP